MGPDEGKSFSSPDGIPYLEDSSQWIREIEFWIPPEEPDPIPFVSSTIGQVTVPAYSVLPFVLTDDGRVVSNSSLGPVQSTPPSTPHKVSPVNLPDLLEAPTFDLSSTSPQSEQPLFPLTSPSLSSIDDTSGLPTPDSTPAAKRSETY